MFSSRQLEFTFAAPVFSHSLGRDGVLEATARELLRAHSAGRLAACLEVRWSQRLRSAAGRAEYRHRRVLLNRRLREHGQEEIDRTLRHELAHLLAQFRAGRRRVAPHGAEWRRACADLGIPGEARCHTLPFPVQRQRRRYLYRCHHCQREFPRTRLLKRSSACLACCRALNRGEYDRRFRLRLVSG